MSAAAPFPILRAEGDSLFIGGSWRAGTKTYERADPSSANRFTRRFGSVTAADVASACTHAAAAQPAWAEEPAGHRVGVLRNAAGVLYEQSEDPAPRLTAEMGKAIRDARAEVLPSVAVLRYFAGELAQPTGETYASADPRTMLFTVQEPVGVVWASTPWNFPFAIPTWKLTPAIGFGYSVVWKQPEAASGRAAMLTDVLVAAGVPDGGLNLITGDGRVLSTALIDDPHLTRSTFTGSGALGTGLRQAVADRNFKVQLELGGKIRPSCSLTQTSPTQHGR